MRTAARVSALLAVSVSASSFCEKLDAILTEPATGKYAGKAYFFQEGGYLKYDADSDTPITTSPRAISAGWHGLPDSIDAILTEPAEGANAGYAFVFKGSQVWKWDTAADSLAEGPQDFEAQWPGLPSDFYSGVDAAMAETSLGAYHGIAFFFKGSQYARYDLRNHTVLPGYPRAISEDWPGMPDDIDTVLMEPESAGLQKYAYFFKGAQYWKWDTTTHTFVAGPGSISGGWNLCPPAPAPPTPPELPEQVHLAFGLTADAMTVAWATGGDLSQQIQWGESESALTESAAADSRAFTQDAGRTWYTHMATMSGLKTNTVYYYRVGGGENYTKVFSFTNRRSGAPYRHVIMGDLGSSCAFSLCSACSAGSEVCDASACAANTSVGMVSEVGKADMILHLGDFGYDLDSSNGLVGDQFMRNIEQVAASVPYMVNHGNHEDGSKSLAHYIERFRSQPSNAVPSTFTSANGETTNTLYFSWDAGLVHYVSISTEVWFGVTDGKVTKQTLLDWLEADLAAANKNREDVPWVVVQAHRSVYCSCDGDCDGAAKTVRDDLEEVFMDYGVDFFINGHEHNYERSYPIYKGLSDRSNVDPKAPIYIVSGAAGSREMHEPFTRDQPSWSAFRSNTFGYSLLTAYNSTHVHWQQVSTDPTAFPSSEYGAIIDDAWIVQHSHGPFDRTQAPRGEAFPRGLSHPRSRSVDHWMPLLDVEDDGQSASELVIKRFRAKHGEEAWKARLNGLMEWVDGRLGAEIMWRANASSVVHWEDVRDDGSSDCATCGAPEPLDVYNYQLFV